MQVAEEAIRKTLVEDGDKIGQLDEAVLDYIVAVLSSLLKDKNNTNVNLRKEPSYEDVQNLGSLLVGHGLYDDEEGAMKVWEKLFPLLHLGEVPGAASTGDTKMRTLEKPVTLTNEEEEAKKKAAATKREEQEVPTYLSCELKERNSHNPVEDFLINTKSEDPRVRKKYLRELCPCHVQRDINIVWDRILEMTTDEDSDVRYQVLHNLCDGSPAARETEIIGALEKLHNDPDQKIRRQVHRVLTHYRRTGKWNIL